MVREKGAQVIYRNAIKYSKRKYVIHSVSKPKEIDFVREDGTRALGVYEINGNEMRIAIFSDEVKSKTDYPGDIQEDGKIIAVYERRN